jgi:hypothetical protein
MVDPCQAPAYLFFCADGDADGADFVQLLALAPDGVAAKFRVVRGKSLAGSTLTVHGASYAGTAQARKFLSVAIEDFTFSHGKYILTLGRGSDDADLRAAIRGALPPVAALFALVTLLTDTLPCTLYTRAADGRVGDTVCCGEKAREHVRALLRMTTARLFPGLQEAADSNVFSTAVCFFAYWVDDAKAAECHARLARQYSGRMYMNRYSHECYATFGLPDGRRFHGSAAIEAADAFMNGVLPAADVPAVVAADVPTDASVSAVVSADVPTDASVSAVVSADVPADVPALVVAADVSTAGVSVLVADVPAADAPAVGAPANIPVAPAAGVPAVDVPVLVAVVDVPAVDLPAASAVDNVPAAFIRTAQKTAMQTSYTMYVCAQDEAAFLARLRRVRAEWRRCVSVVFVDAYDRHLWGNCIDCVRKDGDTTYTRDDVLRLLLWTE